jgi:hypothetical protein
VITMKGRWEGISTCPHFFIFLNGEGTESAEEKS